MTADSRAVSGATAPGGSALPVVPIGRPPIHSLTGLRWFAALLVLFSHFPELIPVRSLHLSLERQGAAGVTIFFVLSGAVLTYNYVDQFRTSLHGAGRFLGMRMARIAPMNAVALLVVTAVMLLLNMSMPSGLSWVMNLTMLQSLVPAKSFHLWNIPAWSISCELIFYVVFPLFVCFVLSRVQRARSRVALAAIVFAVQIVAFVAVALVVQRRKLGTGSESADVVEMLERVKFFPGLRIWEFFLGCIIGGWIVSGHAGRRSGSVRNGRRVRNGMLIASAAIVVALFLVPIVADEPTRGLPAYFLAPGAYVIYTPAAVLLVGALAWGPTTLSPLLEHRWVRTLAGATLSFYLLQWSLVLIVGSSDWAPERNFLFSAGAVVILLGVSTLTARWIEHPVMAWWRHRVSVRDQSR